MTLTETPVWETSRKEAKTLLCGFLADSERDYRRVRGIMGIGKSYLIEQVVRSQREDGIERVVDDGYRKLDLHGLEQALLRILPREKRKEIEGRLIASRRGSSRQVELVIEKLQETYGTSHKLVICLSASELAVSEDPEDSLENSLREWGDDRKPTLKWILEERFDLGALTRSFKPVLNRSDTGKVILVNGWTDNEVRAFVNLRFQSILGNSDRDIAARSRIEAAILLWAGGHPDLVGSACEWLKAHADINQNHWGTALLSLEDVEGLLHVESELNSSTLRNAIEGICAHLSQQTRGYIAELVQHCSEIDRRVEFIELRRAGLATEGGQLIRLVRFFHRESTDEINGRFLNQPDSKNSLKDSEATSSQRLEMLKSQAGKELGRLESFLRLHPDDFFKENGERARTARKTLEDCQSITILTDLLGLLRDEAVAVPKRVLDAYLVLNRNDSG